MVGKVGLVLGGKEGNEVDFVKKGREEDDDIARDALERRGEN